MTPLYSQQKEMDDGSMLLTQWGYCREQNAVRLGYAVNILAALVGLLLVLRGAAWGLGICVLVGASFGACYFGEQAPSGAMRSRLLWASIACTVCAYLAMTMIALGL